jgi:hypothetical protein
MICGVDSAVVAPALLTSALTDPDKAVTIGLVTAETGACFIENGGKKV